MWSLILALHHLTPSQASTSISGRSGRSCAKGVLSLLGALLVPIGFIAKWYVLISITSYAPITESVFFLKVEDLDRVNFCHQRLAFFRCSCELSLIRAINPSCSSLSMLAMTALLKRALIFVS